MFFRISSNPLETPPPEIAVKGIADIRNYFQQLKAEGLDQLYEAKLLIVGEPGAGKTTLAKKIINPDYELQDEVSTPGIEVMQWNFPVEGERTYRVNIWDFGGQEIYHATHQFFLTKRSLYALVADTRKEDTDFFYWLNVVEMLSDKSPLLIVKNEKQDRHREINERQLKGRFSNLEKILTTNLATNRGLPRVLEAMKYYISELPHIGSALPKTWVQVRKKMEEDTRYFISLEEYLAICENNGFSRRDDALQLSEYLHDLGVCLHFQDDPVLKKMVILKPEWGTDAVYKVFDNPGVIRNMGQFSDADLDGIWSEEKFDGMQYELVRLMMKFHLCYEIPGKPGTYIAPQLLTQNQAEYDWDESDNLLLRYTYEFMPKGIMLRFIVAMQKWIADQEYVWKSGVVLEHDETKAEVIEYYDQRVVKIRVAGRNKRDMMTVVMHELDQIHGSFHELEYEKLIPCNCDKCKENQEPHFYRLESLKRRLADKRYQIECDQSFEMVDILRLIDDVVIKRDELEDEPQDRKVYNIEKAIFQDERSIAIMEQNVRKEKVIEIGPGAQISAPVVIADSIQNSFNTLAESEAEDEVKTLLENLLKVINEVNKEVEPKQTEKAEELARDAETLVKEATSSNPRRKWYEVSIDGLEQAANNIGRVAKPVLEIVGQLRKALLGI